MRLLGRGGNRGSAYSHGSDATSHLRSGGAIVTLHVVLLCLLGTTTIATLIVLLGRRWHALVTLRDLLKVV